VLVRTEVRMAGCQVDTPYGTVPVRGEHPRDVHSAGEVGRHHHLPGLREKMNPAEWYVGAPVNAITALTSPTRRAGSTVPKICRAASTTWPIPWERPSDRLPPWVLIGSKSGCFSIMRARWAGPSPRLQNPAASS